MSQLLQAGLYYVTRVGLHTTLLVADFDATLFAASDTRMIWSDHLGQCSLHPADTRCSVPTQPKLLTHTITA